MSSWPSSTTSPTFIGTSSVQFPLVSLPFSHRLLSVVRFFVSLLPLFLHYFVLTALFVIALFFYVCCILSSTRSFHLIGSQNFPGSIRGLVHQAECSSNLLVTPATTTAKGLSHRLPPQVHSLRHRRRRGTYSALAEESATTAIRLYGALASAYLLSEVPLLVSLQLRFFFWSYEGDGTCPPRPPVSIPGHHTLRGPPCCLRYSIDSNGFASLVDSSGRLSLVWRAH